MISCFQTFAFNCNLRHYNTTPPTLLLPPTTTTSNNTATTTAITSATTTTTTTSTATSSSTTDEYNGEWVEGQMRGWGTFKWAATGDRYDGWGSFITLSYWSTPYHSPITFFQLLT